jgi:hypothetical protein
MKPFGSQRDTILSGVTEERFLGATREYARSAYPNPDRLGCPERSTLEAIARRKHPPASDEIDHITTCSPCFIEYELIRKTWKRKRAAVIGGATAAALAVAVAGGTLLFNTVRDAIPNGPSKQSMEMAKETIRTRVVDLRPYERLRGDASRPSPGPIVLERDNWKLTVQLPVGSEEGQYFFELTDRAGALHVKASSQAVIKNYVTTAEVRFDLREMSPGPFTLNIRRAGVEEPTPYPVEVR